MEADQSMGMAQTPKKQSAHVILITMSLLTVGLLILSIGWNWLQTQSNTQVVNQVYNTLISMDAKLNDINARLDQSAMMEKEAMMQEEVMMEKQMVYGPLTYADSVYGFHLTFPQQWKGFKTTLHHQGHIPEYSYDSISFGLGEDESVFMIQVFTPQQFDAMKESADGPIPYEVKRNNKYVYAAGQGGAIVGNLSKEVLDQVPQIVASFELDK